MMANNSGRDAAWRAQFRQRMDRFDANNMGDLRPVSIKVRVVSGCFHREHSPEAYRLIDHHLSTAEFPGVNYQIEEHESGPEILVYLAVTAAGLGLAKSIVELITAIIKARLEGIKRGDKPSEPLELIVRGYHRDGEYFEEKILRVPTAHIITPQQIEAALAKYQLPSAKKKRKKK